MHTPKHRLTLSAATCIAAFALAGCSSASPSSTPATTSSATSSATAQTEIKEASAPSSRLALTHDGGLMVLDGKTFEVLETIEKEGFLRLNPAGDNRHMVVADGSSYTMLDMGAWTQEHGDHDHYYTTAPTLTSLSFAAEGTGHVIVDYGKGAMFADKTGTFDIYNPAHLTGEDQRTVSTLETTTVTLPEPHHGLAIPLEDDRYLVTVGNDEERSGAAVVDAEGKTIVENKECPGIHGEAVAADGIITVGCQDGALIYKDGAFTKVSNPEDPYSRSGNQAGSKASHFVLADYKTDKEAELERPEQFSVIDTDAKTRTKVALPEGVSYTFRSLARGEQGEHLLLTTDGKLRFYAEDGAELGAVDVMDSWEESTVWQDPRPAIWVDGHTAYVTDPASKKLHVISLAKIAQGEAEVFESVDLPEVPNEINGISRTASTKISAEVEHKH